MIGYLKGNLLHAEEGVVLLEANGVGFEIACSEAVYKELIKNGGGEVYTYTAVKEDGISLYGFISSEEKKIFLKLISVSGVGPKMGITVLSSMSVKDLTLKIATGDVKGLSAVKGLGKKTAERIVLELREKIGAIGSETETVFSDDIPADSENDDAVIALMGLGFTRAECIQAVRKAKAAGASTIQQTISFALKSMR
ncbi:MAG: Holliday junction branch migration protein RuvA [Clostridia bacterium]|nr:Holliday junction branch migration protein RuvA [Clostridia bacterium]